MTYLRALSIFFLAFAPGLAHADPRPETYWNVDDVREGMKGYGKTVIKGTKIEQFDVEVLGVLRNNSPGRDLILARLSGLHLERTGVIAGMSGSPVYVQGKLLGAVAYAWAFSKDPIAGITPFSQMHEFAAAFEKRDLAERAKPTRIGLAKPLFIGGRDQHAVTVSPHARDAETASVDGVFLTPLKTPVCVTGMSARSLHLLREEFHDLGLIPMQGGGAGVNIAEEQRNIPLEAGGALTVAMITGDFDMSGIGTVTHVEGKRVYGWGHPFFSIGACDFPLMTGYVHHINARQTVSFKMGSPLRTVGIINADVSTCIAGWLDRTPDMLPVRIQVQRETDPTLRTFNVQIVRQRGMMPGMVVAALLNSIDIEGDLPDEVTTELKARVILEHQDPVTLHDTFSGPLFSGPKGPQTMFLPVNLLLQQINNNPFKNVRIKAIEATIQTQGERRTADVESVELDSESYAPGETIKATAIIRPYKGGRERVVLQLPLPVDLPEGNYLAQIGDDINNVRQELRDQPHLNAPQTIDNLFDGLKILTSARRTNLVLRVPISGTGVALQGTALPDLPASVVQILGGGRRSGVQTIQNSLVAKTATPWVIVGSDFARFQITRNKKTTIE